MLVVKHNTLSYIPIEMAISNLSIIVTELVEFNKTEIF